MSTDDVTAGPGDWEYMWRESESELAAAAAERDRLRKALAHIVATWEGGPKGLRGPQMLVAIAKDALRR